MPTTEEKPMTDVPASDANLLATAAAKAPPAPLPRTRRDLLPLALVPVLMLAAFPLIGSPTTWVTLTVAALAMGMMIFVIASGLTLIFGLMDVLNFGHGAFIAIGAYLALTVLGPMSGWALSDDPAKNLAALAVAAGAAMVGTALLGWAFERLVILPVYGNHLKQILITTGGLIVAEEAVKLVWGGEQKAMPLPPGLRGAFVFGDVAIEKYRLVAAAIGLVVFVAMTLILNRSKLGLLIRAGVENREMVEALGYPVKRLFVLVFAAGSALAGLGGTLWGFYRETVTAQIGGEVIVLVFIVVIIGGLGSVGGCFLGALMVAMVANYTGFLMPKLALMSNILLMAAILMWRPEGLYPVARR
jgi:branched-chain amino acid transport system permease protein